MEIPVDAVHIENRPGYHITPEGRVYSEFSQKFLTPKYHIKLNALGIKLPVHGQARKPFIRIHMLVAKAFIPNPEDKTHIIHLDKNRHNCSKDNLKWATVVELHNHWNATQWASKFVPVIPKSRTPVTPEWSVDSVEYWDHLGVKAARIPGFHPYSVTEDGRILRKNKINGEVTERRPRLYGTEKCHHVNLSTKGVALRIELNRLLALCFIPNPECKPFVRFSDGCLQNYNMENLYWSDTPNRKEVGSTKYDIAHLSTPAFLSVLRKKGIEVNFTPDELWRQRLTHLCYFYPYLMKTLVVNNEMVAEGIWGELGDTIQIMQVHGSKLRTKMHGAARERSKVNNLAFNLETEDIIFPRICPYLNIAIQYGQQVHSPESPSLDKIDPSLGYIKGNIQVISRIANTMKTNATITELVTFAKGIQAIYGN